MPRKVSLSEEKCHCDLSLDADNRYTDLHRIIYRIFCSALFSVEYSDNPGCVIDHPLVTNLETGPLVNNIDTDRPVLMGHGAASK